MHTAPNLKFHQHYVPKLFTMYKRALYELLRIVLCKIIRLQCTLHFTTVQAVHDNAKSSWVIETVIPIS